MSLAIRPATESDIPRIVEIQFSAFEGDPYQDALFPGDKTTPAFRQAANERQLKYFNSDLTARWLVCYNTTTSEVLGFVIWNIYPSGLSESERQKAPEVDWCTGRQKEIAINFLSVNGRIRERIWGGKPHVLLNLLCVEQRFQRMGAGSLLVNWGLEMADQMGLGISIEASPAGYHLYRKLGFEQVDVDYVRAEEYDGDVDREFVGMVRKVGVGKEG